MREGDRDLTKEQLLTHLQKSKKRLQESTLDYLQELEDAAKHAKQKLPKWKPGDHAVFSVDDLRRSVEMISYLMNKQGFVEDQIELLERVK